MKRLLFLLPFLLLAPVLPGAEEAPPIVAKGFEVFVKHGVLAAIDAWLAGSARETDDRFQDEAALRMNACVSAMGHVIGYETVRSVALTASTRRVYVAAKFERGVGWMSFDCFRPAEAWIVCRFAFHPNPAVILPAELLSGSAGR